MRLLPALLLPGCLLGVRIDLPSPGFLEVTVTEPVAIGGDLPTGRVGTRIALRVRTATPLDLDQSRLSLAGGELACAAAQDAPAVYTCVRTLDGTEAEVRARLTGELSDGTTRATDETFELVRFDFTPPTAGCVLSPRAANAMSEVTLSVVASEPLAAPPTVTPSDVRVTVDDPELVEGQYFFGIRGVPDVDIERYTLAVTATDRAGNPQAGDSICAPQDTTGTLLGAGPRRDGAPTLIVASGPWIDRDGTPRVGLGARLRVTMPTTGDLDRTATSVQLGDLPLLWNEATQAWEHEVAEGDADGRKELVATLQDAAGNRTVVQAPEVAVTVDLTPPDIASAALTRTPFLATADAGDRTVFLSRLDRITGRAVSATLSLIATEDLATPPALAVQGPAALELTPVPGSARLASWTLPAVPEGQDGAYTFTATLTDELGNIGGPLPLDATLVLDTVGPPSPPDVDLPDLLVLERQPWGPSSTIGGPSVRVRGVPGAIPGGVQVTAETEAGGLLATATSAEDGSFELALASDVADVWVRHHDRAGNPSPPARVRDVVWTATLADGPSAAGLPNPHVFQQIDLLGPTLAADTAVDVEALPVETAPALRWRARGTTERTGEEDAPAARNGHALAQDTARGVTVLFGGAVDTSGACDTGGNQCSDTWEWDGVTWTERTSTTPPPARSAHALVYDAARGVTVLFGGLAASRGACGSADTASCSDTWEWDGATWIERTPTTSPPARDRHTLAYDAARGVTVLFGGYGATSGSCGTPGSSWCSDTWEWDGATWTERTPTTSPPARDWHALAYDTARRVTVLFGGRGLAVGACGRPDSKLCDDTWTWDGMTWTERTPTPSPPARVRHALAYDAVRGVTVLFGGEGVTSDACGTPGRPGCSDTWEWDGTAWTERAPVRAPGVRDRFALAFDPARGVTVLHGGYASAAGACRALVGLGSCNDTWTWDGTTWSERLPATSPLARDRSALAYDASRGVAVLFGGAKSSSTSCGAEGTDRCADTWTWDGTRWSRHDPDPSPPPRYGHRLASDTTRGVTVLFGGRGATAGSCGPPDGLHCADTWEWDGATWTERVPATSPPPRDHHALAFDGTRGVTVLFGGGGIATGGCGAPGTTSCADTWTWDGTTWTAHAPGTSPPARTDHALAHDAARGVTVLHGGFGASDGACGTSGRQCSDTWEWDGTSWTERSPETAPPPRHGHALAYDASRGVTVLFGGWDQTTGACGPNDGPCAETWEWDGTDWALSAPAASPPARADLALAYDSTRHATVVFGGRASVFGSCGVAGSSFCADTWELTSDASDLPSHTFAPSFGAARAPAAVLRAVTTRWTAGGSGPPGGPPSDGSELLVWTGLGWAVLDAHDRGLDAAAPLCVRLLADPSTPADPDCADLVDPDLVRGLFRFGPDLRSTFAVRPTTTALGGALRSEDLSVTVRYRLPAGR